MGKTSGSSVGPTFYGQTDGWGCKGGKCSECSVYVKIFTRVSLKYCLSIKSLGDTMLVSPF